MERGFIFQLPRDRDRSDRMIENEIVYVFTQSQRRRPTNGPVGRTHRIRTIGLAYCGTVALSVCTVPPNHPTSLFSTHGLAVSRARTRTSRLLASHHSSRDGRTRVPRSIASTTSRPTEDVGGTVYTRRGHTESSPRNKSNQGSLWDTHHEVQHDGSFSALRLRALARLASPSSAFFS